MKVDATKRWLLKIADAVEQWPTMAKEAGMPYGAPVHVLVELVNRHVPDPQERAAVIKVVPLLNTEDFAEAAHQIRERAAALPLTDDESRELVQAKLVDRTLPRHIPSTAKMRRPGEKLGPTGIVHADFVPLPDPCVICGKPSTQILYTTATGTLAAHVRCQAIWLEEL